MNSNWDTWPARPADHTRFVLVRHGETDWNLAKRFQGHTDISLNAHGLSQARRLGQLFSSIQASRASHPLAFAHCVSSDLQRAHHTAMAIAQGEHAVELDTRLRERHYGHLAGLTGDEMHEKSPEEFDALKRRDPHTPIRGGESLFEFYSRVTQALSEHAQRWRGQTVLLVAHGGVLDCIYRHCTGQALHTPRAWPLPNCAINVIDLAPHGEHRVVVWGHTAHLDSGASGQSLDEVDGRVA
ncbi:MAG TPA: histidine phosphatase family protein [Limnobacter sp.]|nr:histidine phosphatase family protein [Limnobacter sp.]